MKRIIFKKEDLTQLPIPEVGYKTLGMDLEGKLSYIDDSGNITPIIGTDSSFNEILETKADISYVDNSILNLGIGIDSININNYYFVNPINGNDSTGEKGNITKPFATILGAESVATAGEVIYIMSNIVEANCGKDGLTYIYGRNVIHDYPSTLPNISGQNWNALYSDQGKGAISFKIIGGHLRIESQWFGQWRRSIVRTQNASNIEMIDIETIDLYGNDGFMFHLFAEGSKIKCTVIGNIYNAFEMIRVERKSCEMDLFVGGSVIGTFDSGYNIVRMTSQISNSKVNVKVSNKIYCGGHYIGPQRIAVALNGSVLTEGRSNVVVECQEFEHYDDFPNLAGDEGGIVHASTSMNYYVSFKSDVVKIHHNTTVVVSGGFEGGRMGLWGTQNSLSSSNYFECDFDIRLLLLGQKHDMTRHIGLEGTHLRKENQLIKLKDITIVSLNDDASPYTEWKTNSLMNNDSLITVDTDAVMFVGLCRIIMDPNGISNGKFAIGFESNSSKNDAYISGTLITNGGVKNNSFIEKISGNDVTTGINNLILNDTSPLTEYTRYVGVL